MYICEKINRQAIMVNKNGEKEPVWVPLVFTDTILDALWVTDAYVDYFYKLFLEAKEDQEKEILGSRLRCLWQTGSMILDKNNLWYKGGYYFWATGRPYFWLIPEVLKLTKYPDIAEGVLEDLAPESGIGISKDRLRELEKVAEKIRIENDNDWKGYAKSEFEQEYLKNAVKMDFEGVADIVKKHYASEIEPDILDIIKDVCEKFGSDLKSASKRVRNVMFLKEY